VADITTEPRKRNVWGWILAIIIILLLIWAYMRYRNNSSRLGTADTTSIQMGTPVGTGAASSTTP
jgi:hypothetical protein